VLIVYKIVEVYMYLVEVKNYIQRGVCSISATVTLL